MYQGDALANFVPSRFVPLITEDGHASGKRDNCTRSLISQDLREGAKRVDTLPKNKLSYSPAVGICGLDSYRK